MVDLGVTFGDKTRPGVEIILPDPSFIVERASDLCGIVLTHAHEDHIGAIPYLWPRLAARSAARPSPPPCCAASSRGRLKGVPINVVDAGRALSRSGRSTSS